MAVKVRFVQSAFREIPDGTYGSQLCMPLPDVEAFNNPNLKTT